MPRPNPHPRSEASAPSASAPVALKMVRLSDHDYDLYLSSAPTVRVAYIRKFPSRSDPNPWKLFVLPEVRVPAAECQAQAAAKRAAIAHFTPDAFAARRTFIPGPGHP